MSHLQGVQVLLVDDDSLVNEMNQGILEDIGFEVAGKATNGPDALRLTRQLKPDVILLDIEMPSMNGIEVVEAIQSQCPTPIVILSAYDKQDFVQQASSAGVGAYLVKPPEAQTLERAITIAMARFEDITALRRANRKLEAHNLELHSLNSELHQRNKEIDTFSRTVAHDLKNPLHLIIGYTDLLIHDGECDSSSKEILMNISETGKRMDGIINELLLLAGIRKMHVTMEQVDTTAIIMNVKQRLAYMIEAYQAEISQPETWPAALGYQPWLEEVWANYISNGLKYGGEPPRLTLGATEELDIDQGYHFVKFWVEDNGAGLSEANQAKLFTDFTRLNEDGTEGHGLGLSIVKQIIEKLGGKVSVESSLGEGCRFCFTLPTM